MNQTIRHNEEILANLGDLYPIVALNSDFIVVKYSALFLKHLGSPLSEQDIAFLYNTDITPNGYFKATEIVMALGTCKALRYMIEMLIKFKVPVMDTIVKLMNQMSYFPYNTIKLLINGQSAQITNKYDHDSLKNWCSWIKACYIRSKIGKLPIRFYLNDRDHELAILEAEAFWLYMSEDPIAERTLAKLIKTYPKVSVFLESLES